MENVLNVTATAPAIAAPNTAVIHSGRLVINTPTRLPLLTPHARSARATSTVRSHNSAYVQRTTPSAVGNASASRSA